MKIKKASSFVFWILRLVTKPFLFLRFGSRVKTQHKLKRPCVILSNHPSVFDVFVIGDLFPFGINYVASDTLFRHGLGSKVMKLLTRPIPISKGATDPMVIKHMVRIIRTGGAVGMFPSGNQSFFGEESHINPTVGKLCKHLGVPVHLVNIHGAYLSKSRWMDKASRGKMHTAIKRTITPDELKELSAQEVMDIINTELSFNEFEYNRTARVKYRGKRKAEFLESALFYCPKCHSMHALKSKGNDFFCTQCGAAVSMDEYGFFVPKQGSEDMPETILDWSKQQLEFIKNLDYTPYSDKPLFFDDNVSLNIGTHAKKEERIGYGQIAFYNDRITVCGKDFYFKNIRNLALNFVRKMSIYTDEGVFTVKDGRDGLNYLKYMVCGYKLINDANGNEEYYGY